MVDDPETTAATTPLLSDSYVDNVVTNEERISPEWQKIAIYVSESLMILFALCFLCGSYEVLGTTSFNTFEQVSIITGSISFALSAIIDEFCVPSNFSYLIGSVSSVGFVNACFQFRMINFTNDGEGKVIAVAVSLLTVSSILSGLRYGIVSYRQKKLNRSVNFRAGVLKIISSILFPIGAIVVWTTGDVGIFKLFMIIGALLHAVAAVIGIVSQL